MEALAIYLLLEKDGKLDLMRKNYLATHNDRLRTSSELETDENDLESGNLGVIPSLAKELSIIAQYGQEEYFKLQKKEIKSEKTTINWGNLIGKNSSNPKGRGAFPDSSNGLPNSSPVSSMDGMPHSFSTADGNFELPVVSVLHDSMKKSNATNILRILNQTPVNSKVTLRYRELIGKLSSLELLNAKHQSRTTSTSERSLPSTGTRENTLTSVDLENSGVSFRASKIERESSLSHHLEVKELFSLFHGPVVRTGDSSSVDESSKPNRGRYNQEIIDLLLNYWLPRLEKWCNEFQSFISPIETSTAASSSKYWMLSAKMSELQLLKTFTKERIQQILQEMEGFLYDPSTITSEDIGMLLLVTTLFKKIHCLLSCHGQATLQCSLEVVHQKYGNQIGYLIGKEVWSFVELQEIIQQCTDLLNKFQDSKI